MSSGSSGPMFHLEMGLTQTQSQVTERYLNVDTLQDNMFVNK